MITVKRVYDPPSEEDGERILVDRQDILRDLAARSRHGAVTLVFGAKDRERNHAIVLKNMIATLAGKAI